MDPISHTQAYRLADKSRATVASSVRDDEHRGGKWEQFTGNHLSPLETLRWRMGLYLLPRLHVGTLSEALETTIQSSEFNQECLKCDRVKESEMCLSASW